MFLHKIILNNFRNFDNLKLSFSKEGLFLTGENGSGKSNILESIYLLCTGRSQRNASRFEMIRHDCDHALIEGEFFSEEDNKSFLFIYSFNKKNSIEISLNGKRLSSFSEWFGSQPVVSFSPGDIDLVYGIPDVRRRFLDMLISQVDREYLNALIVYRRNLCERNKMLKGYDDNILISVYEKGMAQSGEYLFTKREQVIAEFGNLVSVEYTDLSGKKEHFSLSYAPGFRYDCSGIKSWKEVFYRMLSEGRKRDKELGFSSCGPHRDDMFLSIDSKAAKSFSSQGQCRTIALSLKLGSMKFLENHGHDKKIVLFDDAVSELDPVRSKRVYSQLENRGQVMIATPQKNIDCNEKIKKYHLNRTPSGVAYGF
jgi:DNA replication and repair protein RecF